MLRQARGMVLDGMQMVLLSFSPLVQAGRGTGAAATATAAYGVLRVVTCEHLCNVLTIGLFGEDGSFTIDYLPGLCYLDGSGCWCSCGRSATRTVIH